MSKCALITGVTGQDGAYLAHFLLGRGYRVCGLRTRRGSDTLWRLRYLDVLQRVTMLDGDLLDLSSLVRALRRAEPEEVYNLAAQSYVATSWDQPLLTAQVTGLGALNVLEAVRLTNPAIRFYQASSSEMFGKVGTAEQNETTLFHPRSPYAVSKLFAHWITVNYRESFDLHASSGILFNHESPRRGENFVTRKITLTLAGILQGTQDKLYLGNLDAQRDWGYARDYVEGMWRMLQQDEPEDFVLATGEQHSVREFVEEAFGLCGFDIEWQGSGVDEKGLDRATGRVLVEIDPAYFRPAEVETLVGNAARARKKLGWSPKTPFKDLVRMMVEADLKLTGLSPAAILTAARTGAKA